MNPRYKRYLEKMDRLIAQGEELLRSADSSSSGEVPDLPSAAGWHGAVAHIVSLTFGDQSEYRRQLRAHEAYYEGNRMRTASALGTLKAAKLDLDAGLVARCEVLVAGEVLDSVIEQAEELQGAGYKDAAAMLGRVVVENALRRMADREGIQRDADTKASKLNDELKKNRAIPQPRWRLIQNWLDIGNDAAHGRSENYKPADVELMLKGIRQFLAEEFDAV